MPNGDLVETRLRETDLKFIRLDEDTFGLLFGGRNREDIIVQVKAVGDMALVAAPVPTVPGKEAKALFNLLRVTYGADIFKLVRLSDGTLHIAAEVPMCFLTSNNLEGTIRGVVEMVDVKPRDLHSPEKLHESMLSASIMQKQMAGPSIGNALVQMVSSFCEESGLEWKNIDERRFAIKTTGGIVSFNVVIICKDHGVSFILPTDLKAQKNPLAFYRHLAEANLRMNVCKVALDESGEIAFMYELPNLDREAFFKAIKALETYASVFIMDFIEFQKSGGTGSWGDLLGL